MIRSVIVYGPKASGKTTHAEASARDQRRAEKQAATEARAQERQAATELRLARIQAREAEATQKRIERERKAAERALNATQRSRQRVVAQTTVTLAKPNPSKPAKADQPAAESIDQWMARTGKQPEVLPHHFDEPPTCYPPRRPSMPRNGAHS